MHVELKKMPKKGSKLHFYEAIYGMYINYPSIADICPLNHRE
jgi:hypothetical protein